MSSEATVIFFSMVTNVFLEPVASRPDLDGLIQALRDNHSIGLERGPLIALLSRTDRRALDTIMETLIEFVEQAGERKLASLS